MHSKYAGLPVPEVIEYLHSTSTNPEVYNEQATECIDCQVHMIYPARFAKLYLQETRVNLEEHSRIDSLYLMS